jgi:hypothetical protein
MAVGWAPPTIEISKRPPMTTPNSIPQKDPFGVLHGPIKNVNESFCGDAVYTHTRPLAERKQAPMMQKSESYHHTPRPSKQSPDNQTADFLHYTQEEKKSGFVLLMTLPAGILMWFVIIYVFRSLYAAILG